MLEDARMTLSEKISEDLYEEILSRFDLDDNHYTEEEQEQIEYIFEKIVDYAEKIEMARRTDYAEADKYESYLSDFIQEDFDYMTTNPIEPQDDDNYNDEDDDDFNLQYIEYDNEEDDYSENSDAY